MHRVAQRETKLGRTTLIAVLAMALAVLSAVPARAGDTVVYYHTDALHSVTVVTNAQGQVIERTHYAPYGAVLNRSLRDGPGYGGHEEDAATGLVYMQQRYYDPQTGRFLSADSVQVDTNTGANFNRYWYANDSPYRYTDPDGRCGGPTCDAMVQNYGKWANDHPAEADKLGNTVGVAGVAVMLTASGLGGVVAVAKGIATVTKAAGTLSKAEQLSKNAAQGAKAERAVAEKLGDQIAGKHVTLESSTGQRSVADIVTKDKGVVEVKSGGSQLSSGQKAVQADINAGRAVTPRGQNAANAGLEPGKPVQMKCYDVKHC